jgi:hypothetical protein
MTRQWIRALKARDWKSIEEMIDETAKGSRKYNLIAHGNYAIRLAAKCGQTEIVRKLLLHDGVDATARSNESIHLAAAGGHLEIVRLLIERGKAYVQDRNHFALHRALFTANFEVFDFLCTNIYANESKASIAKKALRTENFSIFTEGRYARWADILQHFDKNGFLSALIEQDFYTRPKSTWRFSKTLQKYYFFPNKPLLPKTKALLRENQASFLHVMNVLNAALMFDYWVHSRLRSQRIGFDFMVTVRPLLAYLNNYWNQKRSSYEIEGWFSECISHMENQTWRTNSLPPALGYVFEAVRKRDVVKCKYNLCIDTLLKLRRGLAQLQLPRLLLIQIFYTVQEPVSNCIDIDIPWNILQTADKCAT